MIKRLVIGVVAINAYTEDLPNKFTLLTFCNVLVFSIQFLAKPYALVIDNFAESLSSVTLSILTLMLIAAPDPLPIETAYGVTLMCLVVALIFVVRIAYTRYATMKRVAERTAFRESVERVKFEPTNQLARPSDATSGGMAAGSTAAGSAGASAETDKTDRPRPVHRPTDTVGDIDYDAPPPPPDTESDLEAVSPRNNISPPPPQPQQ